MTALQKSSWQRFGSAALLLLLAALFLQLRSRAEVIPAHKSVSEFPMQLGDWAGRDVPMSSTVLASLGPGDFLTRVYAQPGGQTPRMDLYIAYFPSQRTGDTIHSPKNCLPGAGWAPLESSHIQLQHPGGGAPLAVNRYILGMGDQRTLVLYWYQAHGRAVASEYSAKFYLVADAIRLNRTDGALVRILTPIAVGKESAEEAESRALRFANSVIPLLDDYIPR
jgi:EpsI family protein